MASPPAGKATAEGAAAPTTLPLPSHSKHGSKDGSTQTDGAAECSGQGEGTERLAGLLGESLGMARGELGMLQHVGLASRRWALHKHW